MPSLIAHPVSTPTLNNRTIKDEFKLVYDSNPHYSFYILDFATSQQIFTKLKITTAPILEVQSGSTITRYDFKYGLTAEGITQYLGETIGQPFKVNRPVDYSFYITAMAGGILGLFSVFYFYSSIQKILFKLATKKLLSSIVIVSFI